MSSMKSLARSLRGSPTNAERLLWSALRRKAIDGFRFRRQVPLSGFIVDFVCLEAKLIVEVDGATHASEDEIAKDERRDEILRRQGLAVLRATNNEVYQNLEGVVETIRLKLLELRPQS